MHVIYIKYHYNPKTKSPEDYFEYNKDKIEFYSHLKQSGIDKISIIQRAPYSNKTALSDINFYFIKDEFDPELRWCDKPVKVHTTAAALEPDIVHLYSLDLPIHYRWLRKTIGNRVLILGQHTGEIKWLQRTLWLQQFGLRVVDGFIFEKMGNAKPWLKAAVILPKQQVYTVPGISKNSQKAAERLVKIYQKIISHEIHEIHKK